MVVEERELEAEDYTYHLPDHWILEVKEAGEYFTKMHAAYVQRVVELVKESGARSVLEVGCGDGWNCGKLVGAAPTASPLAATVSVRSLLLTAPSPFTSATATNAAPTPPVS